MLQQRVDVELYHYKDDIYKEREREKDSNEPVEISEKEIQRCNI